MSFSILFSFLLANPAEADFSKKDALRILESNGPKWQRTALPQLDAEAKFKQAKGARAFHMGAYSREYLGRVNQLQFGFNSPGDLTYFTAGTTGIEFTYNIIDSAGSERIKVSIENERLAGATVEQYQSDLTCLLVLEYLNLQRLIRKSEIILGNIQRAKNFVELATSKVKTGFGISVELKRATALMHREEVKKLDTDTQLSKAREDLSDLLGIDTLPSEPTPWGVKKIKISDVPVAQALALDLRADLKVTEYSLTASRELKLSAEKERYPKLTFLGDTGVFGTHVLGGVGNAMNGTIGLQLTLPLIDGGYFNGKIQEEDVKVQNFEIQKQEQKRTIASEASQAVNQLKNTDEMVSLAQSQVDLATDELDIMTKRFSIGSASGFELASSQANLTSSLETNLDAQFAYEMSKLNYYKVTGSIKSYFSSEEGN